MKPLTPKKRGRGQPAKEPTQQIRAYAADVRKLSRHGKTQAEAVRALLNVENLWRIAQRKRSNPPRPA